MRYFIKCLLISMFFSCFLFCSQAIGQERKICDSNTDYSPSVNFHLLSKITLWNSLKVSPYLNQQRLDLEGQNCKQNLELGNAFAPKQKQKLYTHKIPLGTFSQGKELRETPSSNSSSSQGIKLAPYFLLSKVKNKSQLPPRVMEELGSRTKKRKTANIYWLGGSFSYSSFDPLTLQVHSLYGTNSFQSEQEYYSGWLTDLGVQYNLENITPVFHLLYSSENKQSHFPAQDNLHSFGLKQPDMLRQLTPGNRQSNSLTTDKNIGIQIGAQDLHLSNRLKNSFNLFYAKNINSEELKDKNIDCRFDDFQDISPNMADSMWGLDISSYYNIYENLSVGLYFSYTSKYPEDREKSDSIDNSRIHSDLNFEF